MPRAFTGTGGGAAGALTRRQGAVHVSGLEDLRVTLETVMPREANAILRRTVTRVAATVRDDMRRNAPQSSGTIKRAIRSRRERGRPGQQVAAVWITHGRNVRHDAWYWHFLEFGTVKQPAQSFVQPAVERARRDINTTFRDEFGRQFEREMAKRARRTRPR